VNYWWRLYAHLAPLLPDSPVLRRVEANARAGVPKPIWWVHELPEGQPNEAMRKLRREGTVEATEDLEHYMRLYATQEGLTMQEAFAKVYRLAISGRSRVDREEYARVFAHYRYPKLKLGPHK